MGTYTVNDRTDAGDQRSSYYPNIDRQLQQGEQQATILSCVDASSNVMTAVHDASAATNGNAVFVQKYGQGNIAQLVATSAGGSSGTVNTKANSKVFAVVHDATAGSSTGFALYFDHDATDGVRFLINNSDTGEDLWVIGNSTTADADIEIIRCKHSATAATDGVRVYFDHDATANVRLLIVSPSTANVDNTNWVPVRVDLLRALARAGIIH